jgi:acid phosphatase
MEFIMKAFVNFIMVLLLAVMLATSANAAVPTNLSVAREKVKAYYQSGDYAADVKAVVNEVCHYMQKRAQANQQLEQPAKLALVLDIDETVLSNYPHMKELHFGGRMADIKSLEQQATDPKMPGALKLYQCARAHNIAVFFITGRRAYERDATEANLRKVGFEHWQKLYMKPNKTDQPSAQFKIDKREQIEQDGYHIIANVGDQQSDLTGGHADKTFKLPNPFYRLP